VVKAARALRRLLEEDRALKTFVMTTGSRGLHVVVPLRPETPFDAVREYARAVCDELAAQYPDAFTTEHRKEKRRDRLFLDYLRNAYGQHSILPYGVRALPGAPVATPLQWSELDHLPEGARSYRLSNIFRRLDKKGDPWKGMKRHARKLEG
jgi:bifunctional non-homologous end joining protein LigD